MRSCENHGLETANVNRMHESRRGCDRGNEEGRATSSWSQTYKVVHCVLLGPARDIDASAYAFKRSPKDLRVSEVNKLVQNVRRLLIPHDGSNESRWGLLLSTMTTTGSSCAIAIRAEQLGSCLSVEVGDYAWYSNAISTSG
jgi:hypothetical protein